MRLLRRPLASLPARITTLVVCATVVTSLAVTWISVRSLDAFLEARVNEKFPLIVQGTVERLEVWYAQVQLDIDTFARSGTITRGMPALNADTSSPAAGEIRTYLSIVLERFGHYEALFLVDPAGEILLWEGRPRRLPQRVGEQLAQLDSGSVLTVQIAEDTVQIATSAVKGTGNRVLGTLHAIIPMQTTARLLADPGLGSSGEIMLVGPDGTLLVDTRSHRAGEPLGWRVPRPEEAPRVVEYLTASGERRVGAAMHFPRFNWSVFVEEPYGDAFAPIARVVQTVLTLDLAIVAVLGLIAFRLAASVARPVRALAEGAQRVADGAVDVRVDVGATTDEVLLLARTFNGMTARLRKQRSEIEQVNADLRTKNETLERLSVTDELTGLHNHRHFQDQLTLDIGRAERWDTPLSLILIDIDDFKQLNDTHGHAAGDEVLKGVATIIRDCMRDGDLPARYGGEEFALLLDANLRGASGVAERLRLAIQNTPIALVNDAGEFRVDVTVSIGVALYLGDRADFFRRADDALYRAKSLGKNCVELDEREQR
jgi:diguanylate cyclase (GGDEF)-like protein